MEADGIDDVASLVDLSMMVHTQRAVARTNAAPLIVLRLLATDRRLLDAEPLITVPTMVPVGLL
jgi:hypothetical protein